MNDFQTAQADLGLTRAELAAALGISYETLAKWERGERKPDAVAVTALRLLLFLKEQGLLGAWSARSG